MMHTERAGGGRLHEVDFALKQGLNPAGRVLLAAVMLFAALGTALAFLVLPPLPAVLVFPMLLFATTWVGHSYWVATWARAFERAAGDTLAERIRSTLAAEPVSANACVDGLLRFLRDEPTFAAGDVVRIGADLPAVERFEVAFEPVRLDRRDASFRSLRRVPPGRYRLMMVLIALVIVLVIAGMARRVLSGAAGPFEQLAGVVVLLGNLAVLFGLSTPGLILTPWLVVPGALLRRRRRGDPLVYRAAECRLVALPKKRSCEVFILRPDGRTRRLALEPPEAEFLLAAWTSPLPAPTDEQLAGLL